MTPAFSRMGSKVRIRDWVISHFPTKGNYYVEVFAGNANIFFSAVNKLEYNKYLLNDKYSHEFLNALKEIDIIKLPLEFSETETNEVRCKLRLNIPFTHEEKVMEHLVSFGSKGYRNGISTSDHTKYNREFLITKINDAKTLLQLAKIFNYDWSEIDYSKFSHEDFIYFDPPYFNTKASYPNINHEELITNLLPTLTNQKVKWALSGYDTWLYRDLLEYKNKYQTQRNSEIKGGVNGGASHVTETLWTNF